MFLNSSAPKSLPEGGTTETPGKNGWGANAMAAYSPTTSSILARSA